jgi:alkylation response protein AidB-like acyl-CoA dehydrogenase
MVSNNEIERFYCDAMVMCIGAGTTEILRTIVATQVVARHKI